MLRTLIDWWKKNRVPPGGSTPAVRILFVCMGNLCRSPIACAVARSAAAAAALPPGRVEFDSAGTHSSHAGEPADPRARQVAERRGYDLSDHRARVIEAQDFDRFDLILAMDRNNLESIRRRCPPAQAAKVRLFMSVLDEASEAEVPDPYFGSIEGFERVCDLCEKAVGALINDCRSLGSDGGNS